MTGIALSQRFENIVANSTFTAVGLENKSAYIVRLEDNDGREGTNIRGSAINDSQFHSSVCRSALKRFVLGDGLSFTVAPGR